MKLIIIRHADPYYSIDSLTKTGWKEAELLSERISKLDVAAFYTSPLGRAKDTASLTLKKMNREATECPWLREFDCAIARPDAKKPIIPWDWLPADWTSVPEHFDHKKWHTTDIMKAGHVKEEYDWVTSELDNLLARHVRCTFFRDYPGYRGTTQRICLFQNVLLRRYFSFVCRWGRTIICSKILRDL